MEEHKEQFRGVFIPAAVLNAISDGTLTFSEAFLLMVVESLVDDNVGGCWASNDFLAKKLALTTTRIRQMLGKLEKLELLGRGETEHPMGRGKTRVMWTVWSVPPIRGANVFAGGSKPICTKRFGLNQAKASARTYVRESDKKTETNNPEEDGMLFPALEQNPGSPSKQDMEDATTLLDVLREKQRLTGPRSVNAWANDFRLLRERDHIPDERIAAALIWFTVHVTDQYTPRVFNAKHFRAKFLQIEEAMRRGADKPAPLPVTPAVAERASFIIETTALHWPGGEKRQEREFVEQCLIAYGAWIKKLFNAFNKRAEYEKNLNFLFEHIAEAVDPPGHFVQHYLIEINRMAHTWQPWRGDLMAWVVDTGKENFRQRIEKKLMAFCHDAKRTARVMEIIDAN